MTITVVQATVFAAASSGSFGSNVTAGNTVFLLQTGGLSSNTAISSSSPTLGGSSVTGTLKLAELQSAWDGSFTSYVSIWMLPNCPGGSAAVALTVTPAGTFASSNVGLYAYEIGGLGTAPALDKSNTGSGASGTMSTGATGAITSAPEIILAAYTQLFGGTSYTGGFTTQNAGAGNGTSGAGSQIATSSGGSYTFAATAAGSEWAAAIVAVAPPAAPVVVLPAAGGGKSMLGRSMRWADL